jgi:low temperature requirement protein LtrA
MPDDEPVVSGEREAVVPLELFFDLVIVFAFTQVTTLMSDDPTWTGVAHGVLLLIALWWLWTGFARLTNAVDPEQGVVRMVMLGATAALLVISLAAPRSFGRDAVIFAVAYAVARALHVALSAIASRGDRVLRRETLRLIPNAAVASLLLLAGGFLGGPARFGCWAAVAVISYGGVLVNGDRGWQISPRHFVERFAQIVLIALGESIVAIGIGAKDLRLDLPVVASALLGVTVIACLWWTYFDWVLYVVLARFNDASSTERAGLARDVHAYLHSAMVAGIVLFAFGLKVGLHYTGQALGAIPGAALAGGVALYLLAHVALRLRIGGGLGRGRPVAAVVLVAAIPGAAHVSALAALAMIASVCVSLVAYEFLRHRDERAVIRSRRGAASTADVHALAVARRSRRRDPIHSKNVRGVRTRAPRGTRAP